MWTTQTSLFYGFIMVGVLHRAHYMRFVLPEAIIPVRRRLTSDKTTFVFQAISYII